MQFEFYENGEVLLFRDTSSSLEYKIGTHDSSGEFICEIVSNWPTAAFRLQTMCETMERSLFEAYSITNLQAELRSSDNDYSNKAIKAMSRLASLTMAHTPSAEVSEVDLIASLAEEKELARLADELEEELQIQSALGETDEVSTTDNPKWGLF